MSSCINTLVKILFYGDRNGKKESQWLSGYETWILRANLDCTERTVSGYDWSVYHVSSEASLSVVTCLPPIVLLPWNLKGMVKTASRQNADISYNTISNMVSRRNAWRICHLPETVEALTPHHRKSLKYTHRHDTVSCQNYFEALNKAKRIHIHHKGPAINKNRLGTEVGRNKFRKII